MEPDGSLPYPQQRATCPYPEPATTQSFIYSVHNMRHPVTLCYAHLGSCVGTATTLRAGRYGDRIRMEARFSAPVQTDHGAHPASRTMGTRSLPVIKRPGRDVGQPSPPSTEVKEKVAIYLYSPLGFQDLL